MFNLGGGCNNKVGVKIKMGVYIEVALVVSSSDFSRALETLHLVIQNSQNLYF